MTGRIDLAFLRLVKVGCDVVQKRTGVDLWDKGGVERVANAAIDEWGIPKEPVDISMTIARNVFGILPQKPRSTARKIRAAKTRRARGL